MYFTMCFIDGLKPEIKAIVIVQRPKTFDTACSQALLLEEVAVPMAVKPTHRGDWYSTYMPTMAARGPLPLLPLPPSLEKPIPAALALVAPV